MKHIYAEKVIDSCLDSVYENWECECASRDDCPVLKELYAKLETMRSANNARIMELIEELHDKHCKKS